MKLKFVAVGLLFGAMGWGIFVDSVGAASAPSAELAKAKKEADSRGYVFYTSKDEIIAKAKEEGRVRVLSNMDPDNIECAAQSFHEAVPVH